jgi:hypothetical protein
MEKEEKNCVCNRCDKKFYEYPSNLKRGRGKYCSRACANKSRDYSGVSKDDKENNCTCQECNKEFYQYPSVVESGGGKFCSKSCLGKSKTVNNRYVEQENHVVLIINKKGDSYKCLIDKDNQEVVSNHQWHIESGQYAACSEENKRILMHRLIMGLPDQLEVDHINGNRLDNRKENLRLVTPKQQAMNRTADSGSTSDRVGVSWKKGRDKWHAQISVNQKKIHIGYYETEQDAIEARKEEEQKHFGEYARSIANES